MNAVFVKLVNMSVAAGWLILAVLVLRLLLKKAPRWITCLLWAMVAVRLVCPISLQSPVSAYQVAAPAAVQKSGQVEYFHYVYESGDKPSIQLDVDAIRPAEAIPAQPQTTPEQSAAAEPVQETAGRSDPTRYLPPLVTVWLAVGGALLLYGLGSTLRLRLRVREAMRLRDNIWVCDAVTSPFLLGLFRPRVYLPSGMDGAQLDYVLAHEQAHLRRGDHVWKPLGYVLLAAHWFNPLVWLAYWLFCRDIETACDQCVVRRLDRNEKKAYSDALLQCSQGRRMVLACPVAFGEEGVKSRIKAVLQYKKPAFWVILAAIIACIVVAVCFLTDPVSGGSKGTLTFVEKENIISTWRADFTVDTQEAALDANIYAEIWQNGQCRTTQLLTMSRYVNELSVQLTQPERNEQMRLTFSLWAATDAYGGYGDLSDDLKQMPKDTAFAAYTDGEKRQAAAGDDIVLLAVAADLGGGLPEFDCRKLEKQPDIAQNADYMIVVHAAFTPSDTTPPENILGYDTESAHALLASEFRLPTEVDIVDVPEPDMVGQGFFQLASDNRWIARYGKAELTGSTPSITLHSWSSGTLTVESGTDALLWINREANAAYTGDMTGDEIAEDMLEHEEKEYDEHVWLSLRNAETLCTAITNALGELDPDHKDVYTANVSTYLQKLDQLNQRYQQAVDSAARKTVLFGDRFPFRYLVDDYGLTYYAAFAGCSAESEASFETVSFLAKKVDELALPCVLTIEGTQHKIAETIVQNTKKKDQKVLTMDSMQATTSDDVKAGTTYLSVMENNLNVLNEALN